MRQIGLLPARNPRASSAGKLGLRVACALMLSTLATPRHLAAQWIACTGGSTTCTSGNVGIGTLSPSTQGLDVNGQIAIETKNWGGYGLLIKGLNPTANYPTIGMSLVNSNNTDYVGAAIVGQIANTTAGSEMMNIVFETVNAAAEPANAGPLERMRIAAGGNVGIGTTSPQTPLEVMSANQTLGTTLYLDTPQAGQQSTIEFSSGGAGKYQIGEDAGTPAFFIWETTGSTSGRADFRILPQTASSTGSMLLMPAGGPVGIGTYTPCTTSAPANCLLSVSGAIQAKEVVVNTGWSDYVFDKAYRLAPLTEVAAYVEANHRLPDIPSAQEVETRGVSLGDMQARLLAKIEELTLHMIQAEERTGRIERRNEDLEREVAELRKQLAGHAK